jgi:hypothetical protein
MYREEFYTAQKVYDALLASRDTVVVRSGFDGCWLNSHIACKIALHAGTLPNEIILRPGHDSSVTREGTREFETFSPHLSAGGANAHALNVTWRYHIAAVLPSDGEPIVVDPLLFEGPVALSRYVGIFPEDASRNIRYSINKTYAEDIYGKMTAENYLRIIDDRHNGSGGRSNLKRLVEVPQKPIDRSRLGPTLGEFVRTHMRGRRHAVEDELDRLAQFNVAARPNQSRSFSMPGLG